jgi:hypothetical protein
VIPQTSPIGESLRSPYLHFPKDVAKARANKLDKFHPMDLYIYFYYGPVSVGGCDSPYFLESAAAIQKGVKEGSPVGAEGISQNQFNQQSSSAEDVRCGTRFFDGTGNGGW